MQSPRYRIVSTRAALGLYFLWIFVNAQCLRAQNPSCFLYDSENKLPGDELYNIALDDRGFIWLGCDAGLFRFDGLNYTVYQSPNQKSKSLTGLSFSVSGRLYCYNFQDQLFYRKNDSLIELPHDFHKITSIQTDRQGNVFVSHNAGQARYNEARGRWTNFSNFATETDIFVGSSAFLEQKGELRYMTPSGLGIVKGDKSRLIPFDWKSVAGNYVMGYLQNQGFIFSKIDNTVYRERNDSIIELKDTKLNHLIFNKKITRAKALPDGNLWICTHKGIIKYNPTKDEGVLYYPELSFSDCLMDAEGNYWFTTLKAGLLRVQNTNYTVWNKENSPLPNDKISKIASDGTHIYLATADGNVCQLNPKANDLEIYNTGYNSDIQSFDYEPKEEELYFNNNHVYILKDHRLSVKKEWELLAIKAIKKIEDEWFLLRSFGVSIQGKKTDYKLTDTWSEELCLDKVNGAIWIASNKGLLRAERKNETWEIVQTLLPDVQILSIDFDEQKRLLFALAFDGRIYEFDAEGKGREAAKLPGNFYGNRLKYYQSKLFAAGTGGVFIFDIITKQTKTINQLWGLASDRVQDLLVLDDCLWLATGKGLQRIPLEQIKEPPLAKIYLKNELQDTQLSYKESLILKPEASIYSANGNFKYAYKVNSGTWIHLPSSIEKIEIQHIPAGNFHLSLKIIDHLGRDSENTVRLSGFVDYPFWQKWWFTTSVILAITAVVYGVLKRIVAGVQRREQKQAQLVNSQLTALKAQMNPHFIFNVLNSIKSYIYQNDKEKAANCLDDFSDLMRRTLEMSQAPYSSLADELKLMQLYVELEAMMLEDHFHCQIHKDESIDCQLKIPTLIFQPFIENAFKHGLKHKRGDKRLDIRIKSIENQGIQIEIEDNGIGRAWAELWKRENSYRNASFAMNAAQKRIALINSQGNQKVDLYVTDLYDAQGQGAGTRITIRITMVNG